MALVKPQGQITWTPSDSPDVVSYELYQGENGQAPTYDSPHVDVGNVASVTLPVAGLPMIEGTVIFAVAAIDGAGNKSDLAEVAPALIDVTPPNPPTDPAYSRDF